MFLSLARTVGFACLALFLYVHPASGAEVSKMVLKKPSHLSTAPDFVLSTVAGKQGSLAEFKGKVVLLNFWSTWCEPCREEMPDLEALWNELGKKGLAVIAVTKERGSIHKVGEFCKMHEISFPVFLDPSGDTASAYGVTVLPTSFVVGKDGTVRGMIVGPREWAGQESKKLFEKLLNE